MWERKNMNTQFLKLDKEDAEPTLEEAQKYVKGYVELLELSCGGCLLMNEEAKLNNLEINKNASILAKQPILGNVIYLTKECRVDW